MRNLKVNIRAKFSREKPHFNQNQHPLKKIVAPTPYARGLFGGSAGTAGHTSR
jgi:hypothetical protein